MDKHRVDIESPKRLNHYSIDTVLDTYGIETVSQCSHLDNWLATTPSDFSPLEQLLLAELPAELRENERNWNEEELKINFIGALSLIIYSRKAKNKVFCICKRFINRISY